MIANEIRSVHGVFMGSCAVSVRCTMPEKERASALGAPRRLHPPPDGLGPWIPNDYRDLRDRILGEGAE